jgi:hypothetical protein
MRGLLRAAGSEVALETDLCTMKGFGIRLPLSSELMQNGFHVIVSV